jgi:SEC-C motif
VVGRRSAPFHVMDPKPYRPDLLLVLEPKLDLIVAVQAVEPDTSTEEAARWVSMAIAEHPDLPVRLTAPRRLRVDDAAYAAALHERLAGRIEVVTAATPEVDAALTAMSEHADHQEEAKGLPEYGAEAEDPLPRFFEAAAAFYRLEPWQDADDSQILQVRAPALGWEEGCLCVIGALGESHGLLVFRSFSDYMTFTRHGVSADRGKRELPGVPFFSINYEDKRSAPRDLARRARAEGWEIAGKGAFPYLLRVDPDRLRAPLGAEDFRFATACLVALTRLLRKRQRLFAAPLAKTVDETFALNDLPGKASVRLIAPHPEATWRWGEETAAEVLHETAARGLAARFEAHERGQGRSDEWIDGAMSIVEQVLDFKVRHAGGAPDDWTPGDVEAFLLDHFPRKGNADDARIDALPDYVSAFFQWLGDSGQADADLTARIVERIRRRRQAFLREARNPARFGPAKTIVTAMQREGVDVTDRKAVDRFLERFNERVSRDPSALPLPFDYADDEPAASAPLRTKSWVWTPGTTPPDPQGPCPCGSGRRYKKCCMPR